MYYIEEIIGRTFANWGDMIHANDHSFWGATSEIEAKPNDWTNSAAAISESHGWSKEESSTNTAWNSDSNTESGDSGLNSGTDTNTDSETDNWNADSEGDSNKDWNAGSDDWNADTETEKVVSTPVTTMSEITAAVSDVIDDINPFTDDEDNNY